MLCYSIRDDMLIQKERIGIAVSAYNCVCIIYIFIIIFIIINVALTHTDVLFKLIQVCVF